MSSSNSNSSSRNNSDMSSSNMSSNMSSSNMSSSNMSSSNMNSSNRSSSSFNDSVCSGSPGPPYNSRKDLPEDLAFFLQQQKQRQVGTVKANQRAEIWASSYTQATAEKTTPGKDSASQSQIRDLSFVLHTAAKTTPGRDS